MVLGLTPLLKRIGLPMMKPKATRFLMDQISAVIEDRRRDRREGATRRRRNDMVDLFIDAVDKEADNSNGSKEELETIMIATCIAMQLGGYETTMSTLSFVMYYMAKMPEVQERMRAEVEAAMKAEGVRVAEQLSLEATNGLEYVEMVINETVRFHPAVGSVARQCTKDYCIPGTKVKLVRGMEVFIPTPVIHMVRKD